MRHRPGFTLIELIAVIAVLAVLAAVAVPRFMDWSDQARTSADVGSIAALQQAMQLAFLDHRVRDAPPAEWITTVAQIDALLTTNDLPLGIVSGGTSSGVKLKDQRGNTYTFHPETATEAARLEQDATPDGSWS